MTTINRNQLPIPEADFRLAFEDYRLAMEAHALTEGVPAPFPDFEEFRVILANGGEIEIEDDPVVEDNAPPVPTAEELQTARATAGRQLVELIKADPGVLADLMNALGLKPK